jgi:hypothetical protein
MNDNKYVCKWTLHVQLLKIYEFMLQCNLCRGRSSLQQQYQCFPKLGFHNKVTLSWATLVSNYQILCVFYFKKNAVVKYYRSVIKPFVRLYGLVVCYENLTEVVILYNLFQLHLAYEFGLYKFTTSNGLYHLYKNLCIAWFVWTHGMK